MLRNKYRKPALACSSIRRWYSEYPAKGNHSRLGEMLAYTLEKRIKKEKLTIIFEDPTFFLKNAALEIDIYHTKTWSFLRRELKLFPCSLQIYPQINDESKRKWISFAQYCHDEFGNGPNYPKRNFSSNACIVLSREFWTSRTVGYKVQSVYNK